MFRKVDLQKLEVEFKHGRYRVKRFGIWRKFGSFIEAKAYIESLRTDDKILANDR